MDRQKRMIQKRKTKQRKVDEGLPLSRSPKHQGDPIPTTSKLIFKPGTAGIADVWHAGNKDVPAPAAPEEQP
jgi:hypothetical protein